MLSPGSVHQPRQDSLVSRSLAQSPALNNATSLISPEQTQVPVKDFSYLLRPEIYHPLTSTTIPGPFRSSPKQPAPETPIASLLARGHFRAAAIAAVQELTSAPAAASTAFAHPPVSPTDYNRIFALLHTRLLCLTLMDAADIAAQEARALEDLNAPFYYDEITGEHLAPWELRVLTVRLQAMGFGDPRRAVMGYYELARDARAQVVAASQSHDMTTCKFWKARLRDLGIRVVGALVEMEDLAGAAALLSTLQPNVECDDSGKIAMSQALLWLHLGDVDAARACTLDTISGKGHVIAKVIGALSDMAEGNYPSALVAWQELKNEAEKRGVDDEMIGVNMAVCFLYLGRMEEGRDALDGMVQRGHNSRTILFNLATMYELSTDKAKALKLRLAERVASMNESSKGWEKTNADLKLS